MNKMTKIMMLRIGRLALAEAFVPRRSLSSALFISDRCTQERPVLRPKLNLPEKFSDIEKLKLNLKLRRSDTNADDLKELYDFFCSLDETRLILERRRVDIANQIKDLIEVGDKEAEKEKERLKLEGRVAKRDLKNLLEGFWDVEEAIMLQCLNLPNDLHPRTPPEVCQIIHKPIESSSSPQVDHLVEGKELIEFRDPHWYYLKKSAAVFDLALGYYFLEGLKAAGFKAMVSPDFAHHAVVEACGSDPTTGIGIEPVDEKFNLIGGASIFPFCAYFARQTTNTRNLPAKYVTSGRRYALAEGNGLFGAWQRNCVDFFAMFHREDTEQHLDKSIEALRVLYDTLGWDYQIKILSAGKLKPWESMRVSFQMPARHGWVEVGYVSTSGSFFPERLSMEVAGSDHSKEFGHVVSGSGVDVTLVLACLLEQKANLFPDSLKPHSFGLF